MKEDNNRGAVEIQDNRDGRQFWWLRWRPTSTVVEMRDNRDSGNGYKGR